MKLFWTENKQMHIFAYMQNDQKGITIIHIIHVKKESIVDLEGKVQNSVYIFGGLRRGHISGGSG